MSVALAAAAQALLAVVNALSQEGGIDNQTHPVITPFPSLTVQEAINEFLIAKARSGRSDRYLRQLRVSLSSFARGRGQMPVASISVSEVERWLFGRSWNARTMKGYLADVRTMLNFCVRRGYIKTSAAAAVELPSDASQAKPPGIHTPDQVAKILAAAREADLDVMRHLAVRYFAGVRSAEAHRLSEENLLLDRGYVEVSAPKAKTRRRRLIKIQPVLSAWLALGGKLRPMNPQTVRRVVKASGVPWPANVTRHSWCSYHLAMWENAARTALEAGHSEAMLFAHYREVVTKEAAAQFFALTPGT